MRGFFITGTGTGEGKTFVTRGLALYARSRGLDVAAIKPLETGVDPQPEDAVALARASGRPELAHLPGLYRVRPPLAPFSATRRGEPPVPSTESLCAALGAVPAELLLVEGAGGVMVPLDASRSIVDLIGALGLPTLLVARNGLGVISHVRCAVEALDRRGLRVAAVVLTEHGPTDSSQVDNLEVLQSLLSAPVVRFPHAAADSEQALAASAHDLAALLGL